jgi:hypothetical protein
MQSINKKLDNLYHRTEWQRALNFFKRFMFWCIFFPSFIPIFDEYTVFYKRTSYCDGISTTQIYRLKSSALTKFYVPF